MGPETWGPHGWKFIHFITMAYPTHPSRYDKENYRNFFTNLSHVIPCSLCADNYKDHLRIFPLNDDVLSSQENLMDWGVKMHNLVNESNQKKVYSKEDAFKLISQEDIKDRATCKNLIENQNPQQPHQNNNSGSFIYIILFLIIIVSFILFSKYYNLNIENIRTIG